MPEFSVTATAFGVEEKVSAKSGPRASHVYLPIEWTGKKVMVLLLEPLDDKDNEPLSAEEEEELKEAVADVKAGNYRPLDDVLREHGLL